MAIPSSRFGRRSRSAGLSPCGNSHQELGPRDGKKALFESVEGHFDLVATLPQPRDHVAVKEIEQLLPSLAHIGGDLGLQLLFKPLELCSISASVRPR